MHVLYVLTAFGLICLILLADELLLALTEPNPDCLDDGVDEESEVDCEVEGEADGSNSRKHEEEVAGSLVVVVGVQLREEVGQVQHYDAQQVGLHAEPVERLGEDGRELEGCQEDEGVGNW